MPENGLEQLGQALDEVSYEWLSDTHPLLARAVEAAVDGGVLPMQVRRYVMRRTRRHELALRCEQAARYLVVLG